jgi:outer membrane protein assembly factor BamB
MKRLSVVVLCLSLATGFARAEDWTYWRGPFMDGTSIETGLPDSWDPEGGEGSNLLWKKPELAGRSTPVVMNGRLYTITRTDIETPREAELIVCVDAETGEKIWDSRLNFFLCEVPDTRAGWSNIVADPETGYIYVLGVNDYFQCMDGETGEVKWAHSLSEEFGMINTYGGRTNRPIIHKSDVIISGVMVNWGANAPPNHRFLAFDKRVGAPVWFTGTRNNPYDTTYSSPVIGVVGGQSVLVQGGGDGAVHCFQVGTGVKLWTYNVSKHGLNATPLLVGDRVYCGHSEENLDTTAMGAVFCIDALTGEEIWKTNEIMVGRTAPVMIDGRLYVIDDRCKLFVLNPDTGEIIGERRGLGTVMESCPIYVDGKLYVSESNGRFWILRPTADGAEDVFSLRLRNHDLEGSPIVANGRIYIPSSEALYCIGHAEHTGQDGVPPEIRQEISRMEDPSPGHIMIAPCEVLMRPGMELQLQVRAYNSHGQYLSLVDFGDVEFTVTGPGEVTPAGKYLAPADQADQAAVTLAAKYGELTATCRIRIVPDLPWSYDFDNGDIPITWVGIRYRHVVMDYDLMTALAAENPLMRDLYMYIRTGFVNGRGATELVYNDSTAAEEWKKLLTFLSLDTEELKPRNLEQAMAALDPALQRLKDERVIAGWEWSTWDRDLGGGMTRSEPSLKVLQGERGIEGNGVMVKVTTIPLGSRSQGWMGHTDLSGYTIQSDVLAFSRDNQLPGIGLQAQRYRLELLGASQKMQISTWLPQVNTHVAGNIPFDLQPDVWYTVKFQASIENGESILRGKAWVRGEEEPADWMLEVHDPAPNLEGSPGLAGDAKVAEIVYDNLSIYPNPPAADATSAPESESTEETGSTTTEEGSNNAETPAEASETESETTEESPEAETPESEPADGETTEAESPGAETPVQEGETEP